MTIRDWELALAGLRCVQVALLSASRASWIATGRTAVVASDVSAPVGSAQVPVEAGQVRQDSAAPSAVIVVHVALAVIHGFAPGGATQIVAETGELIPVALA